MKAKVQKWGNSLALRIPAAFALEMNIGPGTSVNLSIDRGNLVVRRAPEEYSLDELVSGITKANVHGEELRPKPVGKEVW